MIANFGFLVCAVLLGAALSVGVPTGIALLVLSVIDWRTNRRVKRYRAAFRATPKPKHVKGEPTVRIPIAPIGGAS